MTDPQPITLAYANPRGGQPAGSRFAIEQTDGGVTLTRPLPPNRASALLLAGLALGTAALTTALAGSRLASDGRSEWPEVAVAASLQVSLAAALLWQARIVARPRLQRIDLRGRRLTVTHCLTTLTGRPLVLSHVASVAAASAGFDLLGGRVLGNLVVRHRWWFGRQLLQNHPYDECVWVAAVLKRRPGRRQGRRGRRLGGGPLTRARPRPGPRLRQPPRRPAGRQQVRCRRSRRRDDADA